MRRLHIATEEEMAAIDAAIDADKKAQSTNPLDVADVANFKEELKQLKSQGTPEGETPDSTTADPETTPDPDSTSTEGGTGGEEGNNAGGDEDTGSKEDGSSKDDKDPETKDDESEGKDDDQDAGADDQASEGSGDDDSQESEEPSDAGDKLAEEAISTAATLSRMQEILYRANQRGGVQSNASALAIESIVNICAAKVGLRPRKITTSSLGFESISTRETATAYAIESVGDMLKRIWEAIKNFFIRIFNWVREFFTGHKKAVTESNKKIAETLAKAKETQDKEAKIENDALRKRQREDKLRNITRKVYRAKASQLTTGDVDMTFEQMLQVSRKFADLGVSYIDYANEAIKKMSKAAKSFLVPEVHINDLYGAFVITDADAKKLNSSKARRDGAIVISKHNTEIVSEVMPGNCTLNAVVLNASRASTFEKLNTQEQILAVKEHYFRYERRNGTVPSKAGVFFNGSSAQMQELMEYAKEDLVKVITMLDQDVGDRFEKLNIAVSAAIKEEGKGVTKIVYNGQIHDKLNQAHGQMLANLLSNYLAYFNATLIRGHTSLINGLNSHIDALVDYASTSLRMLESTVINPGQD